MTMQEIKLPNHSKRVRYASNQNHHMHYLVTCSHQVESPREPFLGELNNVETT